MQNELLAPFEPSLRPPMRDEDLEEALEASAEFDVSAMSDFNTSSDFNASSDRVYESPVRSLSPSRSPGRSPSPMRLPMRSSPSPTHGHSFSRASPVSLPIRSAPESPTTPRRSKSPAKSIVTPRKSFYLENSVPTASDGPQHSTANFDPGLIFDDMDQRLPPPEDSPSALPLTEADIIAISSPEPQGIISSNESARDSSEAPSFPTDSIEDSLSLEEIDLETIPEIIRSPSGRVHPNYPAPLPHTLMRPPKLSSHRRSHSSVNLPPPPDWTTSPTQADIAYEFVTTDPKSFTMQPYIPEEDGSDVESDKATIMSDDRDALDDLESPPVKLEPETQMKKKKKWTLNPFKSRKPHEDVDVDEMGETYDAREAETLRRQMAVIDDDLAFRRLDPETVESHIQMFNTGGLHSSIAPRKEATSLIEEIEIRKAGRKMQREILYREVAEQERQRQEDAAATNWAHPAGGTEGRPTLLQMQYLADLDYKQRVEWHKTAINKNYMHERADETLAQRKARLRREKELAPPEPVQETLAERRARLRREKAASLTSPSVVSCAQSESIYEQ